MKYQAAPPAWEVRIKPSHTEGCAQQWNVGWDDTIFLERSFAIFEASNPRAIREVSLLPSSLCRTPAFHMWTHHVLATCARAAAQCLRRGQHKVTLNTCIFCGHSHGHMYCKAKWLLFWEIKVFEVFWSHSLHLQKLPMFFWLYFILFGSAFPIWRV